MQEITENQENLTPEVSSENTLEGLQKKLKNSRVLNLVLAAILLFVGGSYAALIFQPAEASETPQAQIAEDPQPAAVDAQMLAATEYMTLGASDAPVTLYEWTDFTCPYCGVFNRETLPQIIAEYVDSGKVRIEVHDVTYIGPQAEDAAVAARAAGLQNKYFDYLFAIYDLGVNDNRPDLNPEVLRGLAEQIGLDLPQFEKDFESAELRVQVQESTQLAQNLGVSAVPFFVAGQTGTLAGLQDLRGAQPLEQFTAFLDEKIEQATS